VRQERINFPYLRIENLNTLGGLTPYSLTPYSRGDPAADPKTGAAPAFFPRSIFQPRRSWLLFSLQWMSGEMSGVEMSGVNLSIKYHLNISKATMRIWGHSSNDQHYFIIIHPRLTGGIPIQYGKESCCNFIKKIYTNFKYLLRRKDLFS